MSFFGTSGHHFGGPAAAGEAFGHPGGLKWGTWVAKVTFSSIWVLFWSPWVLFWRLFGESGSPEPARDLESEEPDVRHEKVVHFEVILVTFFDQVVEVV